MSDLTEKERESVERMTRLSTIIVVVMVFMIPFAAVLGWAVRAFCWAVGQ